MLGSVLVSGERKFSQEEHSRSMCIPGQDKSIGSCVKTQHRGLEGLCVCVGREWILVRVVGVSG